MSTLAVEWNSRRHRRLLRASASFSSLICSCLKLTSLAQRRPCGSSRALAEFLCSTENVTAG